MFVLSKSSLIKLRARVDTYSRDRPEQIKRLTDEQAVQGGCLYVYAYLVPVVPFITLSHGPLLETAGLLAFLICYALGQNALAAEHH